MKFKALLTAAAASSLIAGAAYAGEQAQTTPSTAPTVTDGADVPAHSQISSDTSSAQTPATSDVAASVSSETRLEVVTSQPVPDTPANRAAFGQPMSRAGKMTTPAGN